MKTFKEIVQKAEAELGMRLYAVTISTAGALTNLRVPELLGNAVTRSVKAVADYYVEITSDLDERWQALAESKILDSLGVNKDVTAEGGDEDNETGPLEDPRD